MTAGVSLVVLLFLLGSSIAVAAGMGLAGVILNQMYSTMPMSRIVGELTWSTTSNFILTAIPFYIMFGEILLRSGTAERMYAALVQWFSWLPGGLMHSNIGACALFGSVSGSSVATAATIGVVAMGEIDKHNYNEPLFLGTLAAGGTLGILIPPSINMIIYGVMTDTSVPKLYLAGFLPGAILTVLFSLTVLVACVWKPQWGGNKIETNWEMRIKLLPDLLPPLVLLLIVIGAIFLGIATATEAAAVGIVGALAITAQRGRLSWRMLRDVCEGTVRTTAMVVAILVGAFFLNVIIQTIGLTQQLSKLITQYQMTPVQVLWAVIVLYLVLGTFMEELSMMISTIPITTPLMVQAGYDPVWYGILLVLLIQTAMISPPFGINLFVIHGIRGRGTLSDVEKGSAPFVIALLAMIAMICVWPDIVMVAVRWFG
ncbi:MAG: C4-dicarboxylate transporter, DctM subunit [Rhodospirillaceae bacterium]|jgi:tripartite ATP-independent transporter DctM subunit|nr:C4-dicarboxylate transporter, DctM subunit [Rhodospirillaceae bacterium]MEA2847099.1 C4-dicarboxylate transporter, DctM subunit [Rhodospirillaceae bacterium]